VRSFLSSTRVVSPGQLHSGSVGEAPIQVRGTVARGSLRPGQFVVTGGGKRLRVRYAGAAPDALAPGRRVTATGRYEHGVLTAPADSLRVSCDAGTSHC
jgi:cytochrome c-type biogenesis protein CcmE